MSEQQFFFDDFFLAKDDPGLEVKISVNGREIPIRIKRKFTLEDIEAAREKAMVSHLDLQRGEMVVDRVDESAFTRELMLRGLVSWPFTYASGKKVPINEETIRAMDSELYQQISVAIASSIKQKQEQVAPFVKNSAEA